MSVRGKITKLFAALVTLAVVATLCVLLVACDPDKGGENTGGGDAIFTEGVTLAELTEKLNAAESFTWSQYYSNVDERLGDDVHVYKFAHNKLYFTGKYFHFDDDETTILEDNYESTMYASSDILYEIWRDSDGVIEGEKNSTFDIDDFFADTIESVVEGFFAAMIEKDGKIVFNEDYAGESYVAGSGYVRLNGTSIEMGYKSNSSGGIVEDRYVISDVNATTVVIPDYIKAVEKTAPWAESVNYNGVHYVKDTDETTGEEYYYVYSNSTGATPETTINTLPVKPRQ